MPPRPRFNSNRPSEQNSRGHVNLLRINLLQDLRRLTTRARNLGVEGLLPWQHYIERLLRQERRWATRIRGPSGSNVAEQGERELAEAVQERPETRASGSRVEGTDLESARAEVVGDDTEVGVSLIVSSLTTSLGAVFRESQATGGFPSVASVIESARNVVEESMLEMETLTEMVRVLDSAAPPALQPSTLATMALFTAGANPPMGSPLRIPGLAWPPETESREPEARETEVLQIERGGHLISPPLTPPWTGAISPTSSTGAAAGSALSETRSEVTPTEEGKMAFTKARREEMMRQMAADIANYTEGRERVFEAGNGYRVYSPVSSPEEQLADEEGSSRRSSAPSPDANPRRRRSRWDQISTLVRNDAIIRDPTEEFRNFLSRHRQAASAAVSQRRTVQIPLPSVGEEQPNPDMTILVNLQEIRSTPYESEVAIAETFQAALVRLNSQERRTMEFTTEDGLGLVEAIVIMDMWQVFLTTWRAPLSVESGEMSRIPYRTRMLWHALREGWASWRPSGNLLQQIGALFQNIIAGNPTEVEARLYERVLDQSLEPLPEYTAPDFSPVMFLRDLPLPDEERMFFLGAYGSDLPDGILLQMARNWLVYRSDINLGRTGEAHERWLAISEIRARRLRTAFQEACRRYRGERYLNSQGE